MSKRIGLIGTGWIGSTIARAIDSGKVKAALVAVSDQDVDAAHRLADSLTTNPTVLPIPDLIDASDLVVEAAGPAALGSIVPVCLAKRRDVVVLSVGGFADKYEWIDLAEKTGTKIYCPSGAIGGLDAVKAARVGEIESIKIVTRKAPRSLEGSPYVKEHGIDLGSIQEARVIFSGDAAEACRAFPANVNVAASLSLAGLGMRQTRVTIVADPSVDRNIHEIEVVGEFGRLQVRVENVPSDNPRTSKLAAFSAIALLQDLTGSLRIGT